MKSPLSHCCTFLLFLLSLMAFRIPVALADGSCQTVTPDTTINIPNMTVRHDTPIGAELGTVVISPPIATYACSKGFNYQQFFVRGAGLPAGQINGVNIYKYGTTAAGIGYAVYGSSPSSCVSFLAVTGDNSLDPNIRNLCDVNGTFGTQPIQGVVKLVFYKIGTITAGPKKGQQVAGFALRNNLSDWVYPEPRINSSPFTVTTVGCTINRDQIDVPLGEVGMEELANAGSTASEKAFSIPISCDTGTKVKLTLTAGSAGVYDNTTGLLNLTDASSSATAHGVKIQILSNDLPVIYEKSLDVGTQQGSGLFTIPLKARYYRVAESIRPGIANSTATYTITYE